jgi:DNA-binding MarR family transcriptional regulator
LVPGKKKPAARASAKASSSSSSSSHSDAKRLAEIFPRMMGALSRLTHAEDMIHENLTPPQLKVLNILGIAGGPLRMSEIANGLGITQASLTETAKRLLAQGHISRARGAEDDRVVFITLTSEGKELFLEMGRKIRRFFMLICDGLSPKDRKKLLESHEFIFKTYLNAGKRFPLLGQARTAAGAMKTAATCL